MGGIYAERHDGSLTGMQTAEIDGEHFGALSRGLLV
jgi:hypothetical protein